MARPPKIIKPYVLSFCHQICKEEPVFVPFRPLIGKPVNECFTVVPEHITTHGGKQIMGWTIWEWPKVFIEAEFHCLWESPNGEFIDLTPKVKNFDPILFLPDSKKQYKGIQVENIRKPLTKNRDIERFIYLARLRYIILNEGDLAHYHGEITPERFPKFPFARYGQVEYEMAELQAKLTRKYGPP
jgi:hypothetical protein